CDQVRSTLEHLQWQADWRRPRQREQLCTRCDLCARVPPNKKLKSAQRLTARKLHLLLRILEITYRRARQCGFGIGARAHALALFGETLQLLGGLNHFCSKRAVQRQLRGGEPSLGGACGDRLA